ncbi:hypothetical protein MBLNU230_g7227t1 [Neophaeotheca triangularis]
MSRHRLVHYLARDAVEAVLVLRCSLFLIPWLLHLLLANACLSALLPLAAVTPDLTYHLSSRIAESVWRGIQLIFTRFNRAKIVTSGHALPRGETAIVVSNHVEWTDFYMIQQLAVDAGMLSRCRWFAKQQLKWVPFLGWGLWAMGMPLVSRKWTHDKGEMDRVFHGVLKRSWPMWLIAYSEATRFSPGKYAEAVEWCKANDKPIPKHTLYPRTKGFIASVQRLRQAPHVKAVYDITVAYAKGREFMVPPSFWQSLSRPKLDEDWTFLVDARRYELKDLPYTDQELAAWLEQRWMEKGNRLETLRDQLSRGHTWTKDSLLN